VAYPHEPPLTIPTPYSGIPEVTLHRHVWERHIVKNHPDLAGKEDWIIGTLARPTAVCLGTTDRSHWHTLIKGF
jgi:hypothetical protein